MAVNRRQVRYTVYGFFNSEKEAAIAVQELREAGFCRNQIYVGGRPLSESDAPAESPIATDAHTVPSPQPPEPQRREASLDLWKRLRGLLTAGGARLSEYSRADRSMGSRRAPIYISTHSLRSFASSFFDDRLRYFHARYGRQNSGLLVAVEAGGRREDAEAILEANGADLGTHAESATDVSLRKAS